MLSSGSKCYHLGCNVIIWIYNGIIWDEMLSCGANVIIWSEMLSFGMKWYHLELMLLFWTKWYHLGRNVIIWDAMSSSGANVIIWGEMLSTSDHGLGWKNDDLLLGPKLLCGLGRVGLGLLE